MLNHINQSIPANSASGLVCNLIHIHPFPRRINMHIVTKQSRYHPGNDFKAAGILTLYIVHHC